MATNKKGARVVDAGNASLLIIIITALIVVYMLVVPPEVREDILNNSSSSSTGSSSTVSGTVLLSEHPGSLSYIGKNEIDHTIPPLYLRKTTNSIELKKFSPVYVKTEIFDRRIRTLNFTVADPQNTKNVYLSFNARKHTGPLTISLNGNVIFEGDISTFNADPIALPDDMLEKSNVLEFSAGDIGWMFWKLNEYSLESVRLTGDVTDVSMQQSKNSIYVPTEEYNNLERAWLKFLPQCTQGSEGVLNVYLSNQLVFSGVPDCGMLNSHEFSPTLMLEGQNSLVFRAEEGNYFIDLINVKTQLKGDANVVYYFELDNHQFKEILDDNLHANLTLEFADDGDIKDARLVINGHDTAMYTKGRVFSKVIDAYVEEGNNAVKLVPRNSMDIVTLSVKLED